MAGLCPLLHRGRGSCGGDCPERGWARTMRPGHHRVPGQRRGIPGVAGRTSGGYVINIGRGERGYARLHRADCGTITRRPPLTGPYIKICSVSLAELGQWSAQRPGATVSSCGTCHPRAGAKTGRAPAAVTRLAAGAAAVAHARTAPGTAAGGGGWEIDGPGLLGEVWLWADRYIPFDQLTPAMRDARAALRSAVRSLAAGPGQILDASYAGHKLANMDVENLVLYNI